MDAKSGVSWTPQPLTESEQFRLLSLIFGEPRPTAVIS